MKKSHLHFETTVICITIALGLGALLSGGVGVSSTFGFLFLVWLIPWGIIQLIHSFILAITYWKHSSVRGYFVAYYVGVVMDLTLLFIGFNTNKSQSFFWIVIIYLPLSLALLLWYITYIFKEPALEIIPETSEGDIL